MTIPLGRLQQIFKHHCCGAAGCSLGHAAGLQCRARVAHCKIGRGPVGQAERDALQSLQEVHTTSETAYVEMATALQTLQPKVDITPFKRKGMPSPQSTDDEAESSAEGSE